MIRTTLRPIVLALALAGAHAAAAQNDNGSAKVNGTAIPAYRLDMAVKSQLAQGQKDTPELRKGIRDMLINQEIVAQEAVKRGLDKQGPIAARLELDRQGILAQAFFEDYLKKNPITDDMLKKEYERAKQAAPAKEYRIRHILVDKEDDAKNLIAQIKKGASFEKLAAEHSIDPGSKGRGGDLDWGPAERYVKPFSDAVTRMKKGQMTDAPVRTDFGYHIIRLEDERASKVPSFDEAKGQIQQMVQNQMVQKAVADLRAKAKVE
jgi:peptidyl-prolyl cis-trans isomerase C